MFKNALFLLVVSVVAAISSASTFYCLKRYHNALVSNTVDTVLSTKMQSTVEEILVYKTHTIHRQTVTIDFPNSLESAGNPGAPESLLIPEDEAPIDMMPKYNKNSTVE